MPSLVISYAHGAVEYDTAILQLAQRLRKDGIKAEIDQFHGSPPEGWFLWMQDKIRNSDFVLVACNSAYYDRATGRPLNGEGLGVIFEYTLYGTQIYENRMRNERVIPIGFLPEDRRFAPPILRSATYYNANDDAQYQRLVQHLYGQAAVAKEPIGLTPPWAADGAPDVLRDVRSALDSGALEVETARTLTRLSDRTVIRIGTDALSIDRAHISSIIASADVAPVVVTGDPGAGKTGALQMAARYLRLQGANVVFLDADYLTFADRETLNHELGITGDILALLGSLQDGSRANYLFIDALDATRDGRGAENLRTLIRSVVETPSKWRVVAAMRQYDLRYSPALHRLFRRIDGNPIPKAHTSPEFSELNHVYIGDLDDDELMQLERQSRLVSDLLLSAPPRLKALLRNPFQLSLAADLITLDAMINLSKVHSQMQLFDLYWRWRVIEAGTGHLELLLMSICRDMVQARSLHIKRFAIADDASLRELLTRGILVETGLDRTPDRYSLAFRHASMFDYAIERLLFRGSDLPVLELLKAAPDATLLVLPSIRMHFTWLWDQDCARNQYWHALLALCTDESVPDVAKAIGSAVAAESYHSIEDVASILDETTNAAKMAMSFVVRALLRLLERKPAVGPDAEDWSCLLEAVAERVTVFQNDAYLLLDIHTDKRRGKPTQQQLDRAGTAARQLLDYAWAREPRNERFVVQAIQAVARTYSTDSFASRALLEQMLDADHLDRFGASEAKFVAYNLDDIIDVDPTFVGRFTACVASREETSDKMTSIGSSQILAMQGSVRDEYHQAVYSAAKVFPKLLTRDPLAAAAALSAVMSSYRSRHFPNRHVARFVIAGSPAESETDGSAYFDLSRPILHDDALQMLHDFDTWLTQAVRNDEDTVLAIVATLAKAPQAAGLWQRFLVAGISYPKFGAILWEVATSTEALQHYDFAFSLMPSFLAATFRELSAERREQIEVAVMSLRYDGDQTPDGSGSAFIRQSLLKQIDRQYLVTAAAKREMDTAERDDVATVPKHRGDWGLGSVASIFGFGDADSDPDLVESVEAIQTFWQQSMNQNVDMESALAVLPQIERLRDLLPRIRTDAEQDYAWNMLAGAAERLAKPFLLRDNRIRDVLKGIALASMLQAYPRPDATHDAQFDLGPSWGSPSARVDGINVLLALNRHSDDAEVLNAIEAATSDESPVVRHQVAMGLYGLRAETNTFWRIIDRLAADPNRGVLWGLLAGGAQRIGALDLNRLAEIVDRIYIYSATKDERARDLQRALIHHVAALAANENETALARARSLLSSVRVHLDDLTDLVSTFSNFAAHNDDTPQRSRSVSLINEAIDVALQLVRDNVANVEVNTESVQKVSAAFRMAHAIAERLYFASGAFERMAEEVQDAPNDFLARFGEILKRLASFGHPATVNHLVAIATKCANQDPRASFEIAASAIESGVLSGYHFDPFAIDEVVKLVRLYLADHHELLESDATTRSQLMGVVNLFARAGWPQAMSLVFELEGLYR